MSGRKYLLEKHTPSELDAIERAYPKAVKTITIRKLNYRIIAMLLECGVEVPGLKYKTRDEKGAKQKPLKDSSPELALGQDKK